ncbi:hypothetical protein [Cellulosimicrobium sp. Marseille-Q4280]|jgi:hypothetical protein|uniref:hypothetical protein n=1 Tax=Cellulosimicrobium sp. Marseille-Q4280 TaxID=2937992 RepID=UPI0020405199|nr:hypothetical protein [Cellulosimicrobium sp. Marseille-Q4280]
MSTLRWTAQEDDAWRAASEDRSYTVRPEATHGTWELETEDRTWHELPTREVAQEVAQHAHEVHVSDTGTTRYQVVTAGGAVRGEVFGAVDDAAALDVLRSRLRAGNLPLAPFRLVTDDGRLVGSWQRAHEVRQA